MKRSAEETADMVKRAYTEQLPGLYKKWPAPGTLGFYKAMAELRLEQVFFDAAAMRRQAVARSSLKQGSSVLILCCGAGGELPDIIQRIGPQGRVVGLDFSPLMLGNTRENIKQQGWTNVELREADVTAKLSFDTPFDVTWCAFGFSVIPHWERAYRNLVDNVKVGGEIIVLDIRFGDGLRSLLNPLLVRQTKAYGGTYEGTRNFMRVARRMREDLTNVTTDLQKYSGIVHGFRRS